MKRLLPILGSVFVFAIWIALTLPRSFAAVSPAVQPQVQQAVGPALPQFVVAARAPAYTLNSNCSRGGGAITFHLTVSNSGSAASPVITQDQGGVMISTAMQTAAHPGSLWSVAAPLPAIPAHGSVPVDVTLMPLSATTAMAGSHTFGARVNAVNHVKTASTTGNLTNIAVNVPTGFCPNFTAASGAHTAVTLDGPQPIISSGHTMGSQTNAGGTGPTGTAHPLPSPSSGSSPNNTITHVQQTQVQLPTVVSPPINFTYTNDPTVCKAHAPGLASALICPGLIAGTSALPLVWDWQQCYQNPPTVPFGPYTTVCGVAKPDGYHIYRVTNTLETGHSIRLGMRTLVDTQTDPTMTIRGISPYQKTDCYVVTAYKGSTESSDSNEWCGASNLAMGTAWIEVKPTDSPSMNGAVMCDSLGRPYPLNPDGHEGWVKYDGQDNGTVPPMDCQGDMVYHMSYVFDLSKLHVPTKVVFVAYFNQETFPTSHGSATTTYPCAITGLMIAGDPNSQIPLVTGQYGVTADITRWFAANKVVTVSFAHKADPDGANPQDTCLADFNGNTHVDVTYYP